MVRKAWLAPSPGNDTCRLILCWRSAGQQKLPMRKVFFCLWRVCFSRLDGHLMNSCAHETRGFSSAMNYSAETYASSIYTSSVKNTYNQWKRQFDTYDYRPVLSKVSRNLRKVRPISGGAFIHFNSHSFTCTAGSRSTILSNLVLPLRIRATNLLILDFRERDSTGFAKEYISFDRI
jgi:hypothetical protein